MHLYDDRGTEYLDGFSSLWVTVHGHTEPRINAAISRQAQTAGPLHVPGVHPRAGGPPGRETGRPHPRPLTRVFFAGDGSSAVEAGIKMAYQASCPAGPAATAVRPRRRGLPRGHPGRGVTWAASTSSTTPTGRSCCRPRTVSSPGIRRPGQSAADRAAEVLAELQTLLEEVGRPGLRGGGRADGAGGRRHAHPRRVVPAGSARAEHRVRRLPADRRGRDRDRAHGQDVGGGARRHRTGSAHLRQGPDRRCTCRCRRCWRPRRSTTVSWRPHGRTFFHGHSYTANPLCAAAASPTST